MTKGPNSDIQAVILCGPGHGLDPLIDEDTSPKCLLPIANKPLLYYPITWLQQSGVSSIFLVAHQSLSSRLTQLIKIHVNEGGNYIDIVSMDKYGQGTMDALRAVRPHLHSDFILLSCDLISEYPLYKMIDQHRTCNSLVTMMLFSGQKAGGADESARYSNVEDNEVFAGMDESRKRLLYLVGKAELEETVDFRFSLLDRFPCMFMRTNLNDAHCYIFRKEFLELLDSGAVQGKRRMFSVREELIPRMVKHQKAVHGCGSSVAGSDACCVRVVDEEFCIRVNNLKHYAEANRHLCKAQPGAKVAASAEIVGKSQIGNDSMVGEFCKIGDKTSIKRSIVGNNVIIGKNVKISNCIIMDKVVIEDNCKLDNSILSHCTMVHERSTLKDCDVGPNYHIAAESKSMAVLFDLNLNFVATLKGETISNHDEL